MISVTLVGYWLMVTQAKKSDQLIFRQVFIEMDQDNKNVQNLFTQRGHMFMYKRHEQVDFA